VTFNEDNALQTGSNAVANWSVVRNFFINFSFSRTLGFTSMAIAKRQFANPLDKVFPLLQ
jgi:hypothetical protein